jgi:phosphotransacetylase
MARHGHGIEPNPRAAERIKMAITIPESPASVSNETRRNHEKYERLLERAQALPPLPTAVAHPCDESSLTAAVDAARAGLLIPLLVGPGAKIKAVAENAGLDLAGMEIVDVPHSHAAAERAVELARQGRAEALMKGSLHSDELLGEVMKRDTGLRTARRISQCFIMDVPDYAEAQSLRTHR